MQIWEQNWSYDRTHVWFMKHSYPANSSIWMIGPWKCGGWITYSWFGGFSHWGQTWREETLARRQHFLRWKSASWQRRHIKGSPFTTAMLCKTEQDKIILHTFSGVHSSVPPACPRRSHLPFSNPKQLHCDPCACVRTIESAFLLCSRFASGVIRYSVN